MSNKGKLVVISGPSGVGKGSMVAKAVELCDAQVSISATTRQPGKGEKDGVNYWFLSREEFENRIKQGQFLEYAEVFGNLYGTLKDKTDSLLDEGKTVILEIDVQGGLQVKKAYPEAVMVFVLPPNMDELERRITSRARDNEQTIKLRLAQAQKEIEIGKQHYKFSVVNDNLDEAVARFVEIIKQ